MVPAPSPRLAEAAAPTVTAGSSSISPSGIALPAAASLLVVASTRSPALVARESLRIPLATAPTRACRVPCTVRDGQAPMAFAVDARTGRVFVANGSGAAVAVFDTTITTPDSIRVGLGPEAVAVDPASGHVFVINGRGHSIDMLDAATGSLRRATSLGDSPYPAFALAARTHHLFVIAGKAMVAMVDTRTGALLRRVRVGAGGDLTGLAMDEAAGRIYAIDQGSNRLHILDSSTGAPRGVRALPGLPWAVAVDAPRRRAFLAWGTRVSILDARTLAARRIVAVGHAPAALLVAPETGRVFVANAADGAVSVLDGAAGRVLRTVAVGTLPVALALDPRRGRVYVANSGSDSVSVLDARSGRVVRTLPVGAQPVALAVDARRGWVYIADRGTDDGRPGGVSMFPAIGK